MHVQMFWRVYCCSTQLTSDRGITSPCIVPSDPCPPPLPPLTLLRARMSSYHLLSLPSFPHFLPTSQSGPSHGMHSSLPAISSLSVAKLLEEKRLGQKLYKPSLASSLLFHA